MFKVENEAIILFNSKPLKWHLCHGVFPRAQAGNFFETMKTTLTSIQPAQFKCPVLPRQAKISSRPHHLRMSKF